MGVHIYYTNDIRDFVLAAATIKQITVFEETDTTRSSEYQEGWAAGLWQGLIDVKTMAKARGAVRQVWLRQDLKQTLLTILHKAIVQNSQFEQPPRNPDYIRGYEQGFEASVWLVGLALGLTLYLHQTNTTNHHLNLQLNKPWFLIEDIHRTITALEKIANTIAKLSETKKDIERFLAGFTTGLQHIVTTLKADISSSSKRPPYQENNPIFWTKGDIATRLGANLDNSQPGSTKSDDFQAGFNMALEIFFLATGIELE